jgi:Carboxypeptidase regulatory-like domain/TonB dependent receptor-like, beta-barrel
MVPQTATPKTVSALALIAGLWLQLLISSPTRAQVTGATLAGTVRDSSGAVIPGAKISVKNQATGIIRSLTTNSAGFYSVPNLTPGTYDVTAEATGFSTIVQNGVTLTVGAQQVLNITMQVGTVAQHILVSATVPSVQLTNSTIGALVNSTTVTELPLNGRSWTDLAALQPGIVSLETQNSNTTVGGSRGARAFGNEVSIAGARPEQSNYRLDGISEMDYNNGPPGSVLGGTLGVEAIQEFSVLTSNYSAEYGRTSGGVVNAVTRSGTNQFHGDAYYFMRDEGLDARNFFDGPAIPPFHRNQFGGSAGGPIQKDKTFIYGDYEGIRQELGLSQISFVPSAAARSGQLSTGAVTVDPEAAKALAFYPLPTGGLVNPDVGRLTLTGNEVTNENFFTIRMDHTFSANDSVGVTYLFDKALQSGPDPLHSVLLGNLTKHQTVAVEENHIFSSGFVNTVRLGYTREAASTTQGIAALNPVATDASLAAVPGFNAPLIAIGGGISTTSGGLHSLSNAFYDWDTIQGYDDAFISKGKHSIKFGMAVERDQLNTANNSTPGGQFTFSSLAAFLTNKPKKYSGTIPGSSLERGLRQTILGAYIQDDWRVRSNLTLNLGLRYEMATVPTEVQGKLASLSDITGSAPHLGDPFFQNPTTRGFAPRIGFAWDPFRTGNTSVRGGVGVFDVLPLLYESRSLSGQSLPFVMLGASSKLPQGSFPSGALPLLTPSNLRVAWIEQNPKRNYIVQENLNVQRQLTSTLTATIGYVGSHGVHMPFRADDVDQVIPTLASAGYLYPNPVGNGTKINANFGSIRAVLWPGSSSYNGLVVGLEKRMSHGFQMQGSFTWSKSIDNNSGVAASDDFTNSISSLNFFDLRLTRAPSDFNIPRSMVISGVWDIPTINSVSRSLSWIVNGWEPGFIFRANDGPPFTVTYGTGGDPSGTLSSDDYAYPDRLTVPGCSSLVNPGDPSNYIKSQCFSLPSAPSMAFWLANCDTTSHIYGPNKTTAPYPVCLNLRGDSGRNIASGPGLVNLDFSLFKNNKITRVSETFNLQFRMEVFNLLNRPNFAPPPVPTDVFDAFGNLNNVAGQLVSTTTTSRQIQFALKMMW